MATPPLMCGHCLHQTTPEASNHLSWLDYQDILMAIDRSWLVVMGYMKNHLLMDIEEDLGVWIWDKTRKGKDALHPRLQADKQIHYTQCVKEITQEQNQ
jgi:hypothetical protein